MDAKARFLIANTKKGLTLITQNFGPAHFVWTGTTNFLLISSPQLINVLNALLVA